MEEREESLWFKKIEMSWVVYRMVGYDSCFVMGFWWWISEMVKVVSGVGNRAWLEEIV